MIKISMVKFINIFFLFLGLILFSFSFASESTGNDELDMIIEDMKSGGFEQVDSSILALESFLKKPVSNDKASVVLVEALHIRYQFGNKNINDIVKANRVLSALITKTNSDKSIDYSDLYYKRALGSLYLDDQEKATSDLNKSIDLNRMNIDPWLLRVELLLSNNKIEQASQLAQSALLNVGHSNAHFEQIGDVFFTSQNWQEALYYFKRVKLNTKNILHKQAICHEQLKEFGDALDLYIKILSKNNNSQIRIELAKLYLKMGSFNEALKQSRLLLSSSKIEDKSKTSAVGTEWELIARAYEGLGLVENSLAAWINVKSVASNDLLDIAEQRITQLSKLLE